MDRTVNSAIILGAGLSGTVLTIQLARKMPPGSRLVLIGQPGEIGVGLAYRNLSPDFRVNVRAAGMSIDPDDASHFTRWLGRETAKGRTDSSPVDSVFAQRSDYGRYLRETLFDEIENAKSRVSIEVVEGTAVELRPVGNAFEVRLASGQRHLGRKAAICSGNSPSRFPIRSDAVENGARPRMVADPWNDLRMRTIASDASLLLIGTGLTMVDQVLSLRRNGHRGPITALSRHGLVPAAHSDTACDPEPIDLQKNSNLRVLVHATISAARRASTDGRDWRAVIDGLRPFTQQLWQSLSVADKRRFRRHVESFWGVHRHRMAPQIGDLIQSLRARGIVTVIAGRVEAVRAAEGRLRVAFRRRASSIVEIQPFEWIVNCTGPGRLPSHSASPLVGQMLAAGLIRPDELGLGIDVDTASRVLDAAGRASHSLFALGPLTIGRFWEIVAVREIRAQAAGIADRIAMEASAATLIRHLHLDRGRLAAG